MSNYKKLFNKLFVYLKKTILITLDAIFSFIICISIPLLWVIRSLLRLKAKYRKRSIWTGAPIINMTVNAACERLIGFDSKTIVRSTYFITNAFDINISKIAKMNALLTNIYTYLIFLWICATADRVHTYVDGGILPSKHVFMFRSLELFLYQTLGVKLFIWTYGADVRTETITRSLGESNCCIDCPNIGAFCVCDERKAQENFLRVSKAATALFSMGDMEEYTPNSHNDLFFWPIDFERDQFKHYLPANPSQPEEPLHVVHAPNHRYFKGTKYLEEAVKELNIEGLPIKLTLVERIPNDQALLIYRSADIIFDQCLIGFHGYFAIEALALGRPVMCYIRKPEQYLLNPEMCPIINITRENLKDMLRYYATEGRGSLESIGQLSRDYVRQNFSKEAFAERLRKKYDLLGVSI